MATTSKVYPVSTRTPERIGSYRLIKPLGKGQIFEVWEVERAGGGERLAMKLLLPGRLHVREHIRSLRYEFAVGRGLQHPNVISSKEFVTGDGGTYMVQELVRGSNLKERIHEGVEHLAHLADDIIRGAAQGLGYLHSQGWIHRDVKPDNFLISEANDVKLIDFNIAERKRGFFARMIPRRRAVQGTQSYMSPEQIRSETADERSDMYSLGCLVHELISGKPPFTGTSTQELLNKHLKAKAPSLVATDRQVNGDFARLVQRMISKSPRDRPANMEQFLEEFAGIRIFTGAPRP